MRLRWLGILLGVSIPVVAVGCIPDPKGDFDDYKERTAPFRNQEAGAFDAALPAGSVQGLYFTACLSQLDPRVNRVLRFYSEVTYVQDAAPATTGKMSIKLTAMKLLQPGDLPPPTVSKDQTVGDTYTIVDQPTNALGVYQGAIGSDTDGNGRTEVKIPGASNPISGRQITVETAALNGRFGPGRFCSQLTGEVVEPIMVTLEGKANTCLYFPIAKEGDPPPTLTLDDFKAGCPLE